MRSERARKPKIDDIEALKHRRIKKNWIVSALRCPCPFRRKKLIRYRLLSALHEATHMVASLACSGSSILSAQIPFTLPEEPGPSPIIYSCEDYLDEKAFVSLSGVAWELDFLCGDPKGGADDIYCDHYKEFDHLLVVALAFVREHRRLIRAAALGLLLLKRHPEGEIDGYVLKPMADALRREIKPFRSYADVVSTQEAKDRGYWVWGAGCGNSLTKILRRDRLGYIEGRPFSLLPNSLEIHAIAGNASKI